MLNVECSRVRTQGVGFQREKHCVSCLDMKLTGSFPRVVPGGACFAVWDQDLRFGVEGLRFRVWGQGLKFEV